MMAAVNPWMPAPEEPEPVADPQPAGPTFTGASAPQPGGMIAQDWLGHTAVMPTAARVWLVGVHGGAGETTVARALQGAAETGHLWPHDPTTARPIPTVLVARTHFYGLESAGRALAQWAARRVPGVELVGTLLVPDGPGKLSKVTRARIEVLSGGSPLLWQLPWVESWRTEVPDAATVPRPAAKVFDQMLRSADLMMQQYQHGSTQSE